MSASFYQIHDATEQKTAIFIDVSIYHSTAISSLDAESSCRGLLPASYLGGPGYESKPGTGYCE
jgi:hypothetical protein